MTQPVQVFDGAGESEFPLLPGFVPILVMVAFDDPFKVYMMSEVDLAKFEGTIELDQLRHYAGKQFSHRAFQFELSVMDKAGSLFTLHEAIRVEDQNGHPRFVVTGIE